MIKELISDYNIEMALNHLENGNESKGYDGVYVSQLREYIKINGKIVFDSIVNGEYIPQIVINESVLNKKGKIRTISKLCAIDKLITRCIYQILCNDIEKDFCNNSFAYQKGKSYLDAVEKCKEFISNRYKYVICIDLENYFDNINHEIMMKFVRRYVKDDKLLTLIERYIKCQVLNNDGTISTKDKGLVQGSSLSPLLSNLYLNHIDKRLDKNNISYVRFADDLKIFTKNYEDALRFFNSVRQIINESLKLGININKSGINNVLDITYFGYKIRNQNGKYIAYRQNRNDYNFYSDWKPSALSEYQGHFHIMEDGILSRKDLTILFENEDTKKFYPIEIIENINIYANEIYSSNFFGLMNEKQIEVNMFSKYGDYIGSFIPRYSKRNNVTLINQMKAYLNENKRLNIAREIENAALHNMLMNLRYYQKKRKTDNLDKSIKNMEMIISSLKQEKSIEKMMLSEARAKQIYYHCFNDIITNENFKFKERTKRPPKDPLNALISFGNTYLYNRLSSIISRNGLDNKFAFIHSSNKNRNNLSYDLADIYKPIIVDRVIFTIINKSIVNSSLHFENINNGIYLNKEGMRTYINELKNKLGQKINKGDRQLTYLAIIKDDIKDLIETLNKDKRFNPFLYY